MNLQRTVLFALLLFLSLKIYDLWQHRNDSLTPASPSAVVLPNASQQKIINQANDAPSTQNRSVSTVTTPNMRVSIDKKGARIVDVELLKYPKSTKKGAEPIHLLSQNSSHPYFATTGFVGDEFVDFHSLNGATHWSIQDARQKVTFVSAPTDQGIVYEKAFLFDPKTYTIEVKSTYKNQSGAPQDAEYYTAFIAKQQTAIASGEKLPDASSFRAGEESASKSGFVYNTYTGPSYTTEKKPYTKFSFDKASKEDRTEQGVVNGWISIQKRYFLSAWMPQSSNPFSLKTNWYDSHSVGEDGTFEQYFGMSMSPKKVRVDNQTETTQSAVLYAGPELVENLKGFNRHLELTVDYGWLWMISDLIYRMMSFFHDMVKNWGLSIILVTFLIKLLFYKLNEISFRSTAKMKKVAPQIEQLKKNYEHDPMAKNQAIMDLYRREKLNPLMGCLPLLLQMPIFFALYWVLMEAVHLRHAPFLWLADLSTKDPFYILPALMGASMILQQKMTPMSNDPSQVAMRYMFPIMLTLVFSQMPSGLVLYMLVNNLTSIAQQWHITKKLNIAVF